MTKRTSEKISPSTAEQKAEVPPLFLICVNRMKNGPRNNNYLEATLLLDIDSLLFH